MTPIRGWWAGAAGAARKSRPPTPLDRRLLGLGVGDTREAPGVHTPTRDPQPAIPYARARRARVRVFFIYIPFPLFRIFKH